MNTNRSVFTFINNTHLTDLSFISCSVLYTLHIFCESVSYNGIILEATLYSKALENSL